MRTGCCTADVCHMPWIVHPVFAPHEEPCMDAESHDCEWPQSPGAHGGLKLRGSWMPGRPQAELAFGCLWFQATCPKKLHFFAKSYHLDIPRSPLKLTGVQSEAARAPSDRGCDQRIPRRRRPKVRRFYRHCDSLLKVRRSEGGLLHFFTSCFGVPSSGANIGALRAGMCVREKSGCLRSIHAPFQPEK